MKNLEKNCRICREWQEHYYWNHMADEKKHFFKPMVGDFTETMSIPARFANNFNGHISKVIRLKSPSGKTWSIGVGSDDADGVALQSGWKEFVGAHGIGEGDGVLFKYGGVSSFDVLMFDSSGCEKTWPHFTHNIGSSHGDQRIESSAGINLGGQGPRLGCRRFNGGDDCTCTPQSLPSDGDGDEEEDDGHDAHLELAHHKNASRRSIPKRCKRKLYRDIEQVRVETKDDDDSSESERSAETGYYFCKNGPVSEYHLTEQEREEISSVRVPELEQRNPVYVQVMHPTHLKRDKPGVVVISAEFADKYLGPTPMDVILERAGTGTGTGSKAKCKWLARYNRNRFCRGFTGRGWRDFVRDNGLLGGDVCLFELLMNGKRRPTVAVHVLRKVGGGSDFVLLSCSSTASSSLLAAG